MNNNNSAALVVSSRKVLSRGKVQYDVVSAKKPERKEKAQIFELKHSNISDDRAAAIANSLAPEDQNEHQKPKKKRMHKDLGKKVNFDNSTKAIVAEPAFIAVDMVKPDLDEPTKRQVNGDDYRGSSLYRMRNRRKNSH